jgi:hypothetical protein
MKYIISEGQYNRIINEGVIEFPGIEYFNNDWSIVARHLNKFTFNGEQYSNINDFKKVYYIQGIQDFVMKDNRLNDVPEGNDYGINLYELTNVVEPIRYQDNPNTLITMFYMDKVYVEEFDDSEDQYPFKEEYVKYEDLDIDTIEAIYELLALNIK